MIKYLFLLFFYINYAFAVCNDCKQINIELEKENNFVLQIPNGSVFSDKKIIIDSKNNIIKKVLHPYTAKKDFVNFDIKNYQKVNFDGTLAVIDSCGTNNYFHWIVQILPRLYLIQKSGLHFDKLWFSYEFQANKFQKETLKLLNIKPVVAQNEEVYFKATNIISTNIIGNNQDKGEKAFTFWIKDFLNNLIIPNYQAPAINKIYIDRDDDGLRAVENSAEIRNLMTRKGYKIVKLESLSVVDQAKTFHDAKIIVGVHGAGFTNLFFAQKGVKVIEINAEETFMQIGNLLNANYHYFCKEDTACNFVKKIRLNAKQKDYLNKNYLTDYSHYANIWIDANQLANFIDNIEKLV